MHAPAKRSEYGMQDFAHHLLLGGANCAIQNEDGDQPSHIACRDNQVEALKMICRYDQHIGRVNFNHHTPLGMAKLNNSRECIEFLEEHYRMVEVDGGRNDVGEIWWDRTVDEINDEWETRVSDMMIRQYINKRTGEIRDQPPSFSALTVARAADHVELPLHPKVVLVGKEGENDLTRHTYVRDYKNFQGEVGELRSFHRAAACIQKYARRKLAYMEAKSERSKNSKKSVIARFIKRYLGGFMRWKSSGRYSAFSKIQAKFKADQFRKEWSKGGAGHNDRAVRLKRRRLGRSLLRVWKNFKIIKQNAILDIAMKLPKTGAEWQKLVDKARYVHRTVGVYEEYIYPGYNYNIYFYRHRVSFDCTFEKPLKMEVLDNQRFADTEESRKHGCTLVQKRLITSVQALYRGYKIRSYYTYVESAMNISMQAEKMYMTYPDLDSSLYNYALHCHVIEHDYDRARTLYMEALRRMEWRGPDVAFVLYSYAIFAFFTHDLDYSDVVELLERARKAEEIREQQSRQAKGEELSQAVLNGTYRHGKIFDLANIGFFRKYASDKDDEDSWHNYAICRFLVYSEWTTSFDAFLESFKHDSVRNPKLKGNFDLMMRHFHGPNKKELEVIVRKRMQYLAERDAEVNNLKQFIRENATKRRKAAIKLQRWYRDIRNQRGFLKFMTLIRSLRAAKTGSKDRR